MMWYEKQEEQEEQKKTPGTPQDVKEAPGHNSGAFMSGGFPGNTDPTKAFEEDKDELAGGPATADEIGSLKKVIKDLEEKANLNYDRYLRALAEMDNFKKRMNRERADLIRFAGEDLLMEFLPVVDNLERTLEHGKEATDIKKMIEGIELVYRQLLKSLEKTGVARIDKTHCPFDPEIHQALQRVVDKTQPDDTVVEILQRGYILNGKVIRPAMVKVAKHT